MVFALQPSWSITFRLWLCALSIALTGCASIRLVGDYDEKIDSGVTQLQKDTATYLTKIQSVTGDKVEAYDEIKFYPDTRVAIGSLRLRADATQRNSITVQQLDLLQIAFNQFEEMHNSKEGLKKSEMADLEKGFNGGFLAILTFEIAKKRGETVNAAKALEKATPKPGATK